MRWIGAMKVYSIVPSQRSQAMPNAISKKTIDRNDHSSEPSSK